MPEAHPLVPIIAPAGHALVQPLADALVGLEVRHLTQVSQVFLALSRPDVQVRAIVILGDLPGMTVPTMVRALRGLPGRAEVPLLAEADPLPDGCQALPRPIDAASLARLLLDGRAAQEPQQVILDPLPLARIDRISPGTGRELALVVLADLGKAAEDFPRWLADGDLEHLGGTAHRLKGSTGSVGAMEVAAALGQLEHAARGGDRAASAPALEAVLQAIARVGPSLAAVAGSRN